MKALQWVSLIILLLLGGCASRSGDLPNAPKKVADTHAEEDSHEGEDSHEDEGIHLSEEQSRLAEIKTERVTTKAVQEQLAVPGTIAPTVGGRAVVTPPAPGRIVELSIKLGEQVTKGQTLAILESPELAEAWARVREPILLRDEGIAKQREALSQLMQAETKLTYAKKTLSRQKELAKAGAFSQAPLQQAQTELNEAQSELLSAQKEQASHAEQLKRIENLYKSGIVSQSEYDAAKLESQQDVIRVNRASARVEIAKRAYERERSIAERELLNAREIQAAESELRAATLEVERARNAVKTAKELVSSAERAIKDAKATYQALSGGSGSSGGRVRLVAPITGTLTKVEVTRGEAVDRTQTVFEIEDLSAVWATAQVPEKYSGMVRKGSLVKVTGTALGGKNFSGQVQVVGSRIDDKTRTLSVQCLLNNSESTLKPGMFVQVFIELGRTKNALVISESALDREGEKTLVYLRKGAEYERREVKTGISHEGLVEVESGLKDGEEIVVQGAFILKSQLKKGELKGHDH